MTRKTRSDRGAQPGTPLDNLPEPVETSGDENVVKGGAISNTLSVPPPAGPIPIPYPNISGTSAK